MKHRVSIRVGFCLILAAATCLPIARAEDSAGVPTALVDGNTEFALTLFGKLAETDGNLFFSPYSISTALAMTYAGARGNTEKQMAAALRFTLPQEKLHPAFAAMEARLVAVQEKGAISAAMDARRGAIQERSAMQLSVANSLWPQKTFPILPDFLALTKKHYGVSITPLDFVGNPEGARKEINAWVEDKTSNKIREIVPAGFLDPLTRLVLVNTIYFKGAWSTPFEKTSTQDLDFFVQPKKVVKTPLMFQSDLFKYGETDGLQVLELPYAGYDFSMLVLLPRQKDGLAKLQKQLSTANLKTWQKDMRMEMVRVFLPRFRTTSLFRLDSTLRALGMSDAFDRDKATFTGMRTENDLWIGAVVHKAFVDVNEKGTEAAAATAEHMFGGDSPARIGEFRADHPFLFLIRENSTGSILFMGRVTDPTASP